MKRNIKSLLATVLLSTMFIANTNVQVFAEDAPKFKAVDAEIIAGETYVIDDKGTLWVNNEAYEFNEVTDDVAKVYEALEEDTCFILKKDGTLLYAEESRKVETGEDGTNKLKNNWKFYDVTDNVKSVSFSIYYDEDDEYKLTIFVLKNEGSIYQLPDGIKLIEDIVAENKTEEFKLIASDVKSMQSNNEKNIYYVTKNGDFYLLENQYKTNVTETLFADPIKLASNVEDVIIGNDLITFTAKNGYVYKIDDSYDEYYYYDDYLVGNDNAIDKEYLQVNEKFKKSIEPEYITSNVKKIVPLSDYGYIDNLFVIKEDNTLWARGSNFYGQMGFENKEVTEFDEYMQENVTYEPTEYYDLIKIADNVVDVASKYDATVFTTTDGKLYATGDIDFAQITNKDDTKSIYQDENGFYVITDGVADVSLSYGQTLMLKDDGSLWTVGFKGNGVYNNEEPDQVGEIVAVTDNVKWANQDGSNSYYITGDKDSLYRRNDLKEYAKVTEYETGLLGIKLSEKDKALIYNGGYDFEEYYEKLNNLSSDKYDEFYQKSREYFESLRIVYDYIADDVAYATDGLYLTNNNELYGIMYYADDVKIAENVKTFYVDEGALYIVGEDGSLKIAMYDPYMTNKLDFDFFVSDIENVKEIKSDASYYAEYVIYVLDNENSLWKYSNLVPDDYESANLADYFVNKEKELVAENVSSFDVLADGCVYVIDGVLYGVGSNEDDQFGTTGVRYYSEPVEIMTGVAKVEAVAGYYSKTVVLKEDGTVISMGANEFGELGFVPEGEYGYNYNDNRVYIPFEVDINR